MNVKTFIWNGDNFFFIPDLSFSVALFFEAQNIDKFEVKNRIYFSGRQEDAEETGHHSSKTRCQKTIQESYHFAGGLSQKQKLKRF